MKRSKAPSALAKKVVTPSSGVKSEFKSPLATSKTPPKKEKEEEQTHKDENNNVSQDNTNDKIDDASTQPTKAKSTTFKAPFKSPVTAKAPAKVAAQTTTQEEAKESIIYRVMWCNYTTKKHKSYNDGVLQITGQTCILKDMEGKDLGKSISVSKKLLDELGDGSNFKVAGKEVEILQRVAEEEFTSGKIFLESQSDAVPTAKTLPTSSASTKKKFKSHAVAGGETNREALKPRHDPDSDGAVVLFRPSSPFDSNGKPQVAVVVDPHIAVNLRPHQRQGVKFMYNCVMGGVQEGNGCILADEILGKTLQSITLIWTLLKQGPNGQPAAKKVVVITPASLIDNWRKEVKRWLGSARLKPLSISDTTKGAKDMIKEFTVAHSSVHPLLLITYEQCRLNAALLENINCGLVICDEGHRIKNSSSKTAVAIAKINTKSRIILSGTPLQNDLEEFYSMVDFCNPGILGHLPSFKKLFAQTINNGRLSNAKPEERKIGQARSKQLTEMTSKFILRRRATILEKYLPPKVEQVVFCKMAPLQVQFYKLFLRSKTMAGLLSGQDAYALECVISLKKLTNHPSLIWNVSHGLNDEGEVTGKKHGFDGCAELFPAGFDHKQTQPEYSGKVQVLASLLKSIKKSSNDKVVLVSNSKKTLNIFQQLMDEEKYTYVRLDGDLAISQRQKMVDDFNTPSSNIFAFLLSSKAGGVGLNLIGANRLVLFDPDWNPANDKQAMARIWRDGQTKTVWIYRFLSVGTIDEKIYQRQIMKQGLSNSVVDDDVNSKRHFKSEDLKNIFSLNESTLCDTHDLIKCNCLSSNARRNEDKEGAKKSEISSWLHYASPEKYLDPVLKEVAQEKDSPISFVFCSPPADVKKEESEEDIVNEAAREDIYMTTEDRQKEEEEEKEIKDNADEEEGETKKTKRQPRKTKNKIVEDAEIEEKKEETEKEEKGEKGEEEEEEIMPKRKKTRTEDKENPSPNKSESPNEKVRVRGRLTKKVEEDPVQTDDLDLLELEV